MKLSFLPATGLLAALWAAGCQPGAAGSADPKTKTGHPTAVVADISGQGINPYYAEFRRPDWTDHPSRRIPGFPADAPALRLTLGDDFAANVAADAALWATVEPGIVYWVPGTSLLLLAVRSPEGDPAYSGSHTGYAEPGPNNGAHALDTAVAVTRTCPECYLLAVQDSDSIHGGSIRFIADTLPWVDVVQSTQYSGTPQDFGGYADATRALHESGRLFVTATGNSAVTGIGVSGGGIAENSSAGFPPWVYLVGGGQLEQPFTGVPCNATYADAAKPAEVVGDYAWILPTNRDMTEQALTTGTSFAAPQVAGQFGRTLIGVRTALGDRRATAALWAGKAVAGTVLEDGRLTQEEVRATLNATATLFTTPDFNPLCSVDTARTNTLYLNATEPLPVSPQPWVDIGWGFVGNAAADAAVDVIRGAVPAPAKPDEAQAYMDQVMALRRQRFPGE